MRALPISPTTVGRVGSSALDDDEEAAWIAFISAATRALDRLDRELQADQGLSLADYEILVRLSRAPTRQLLMSDLAAETLLSQSRLTYRIDRLEREGLVYRVPCETDGRRIWAKLTRDGIRRLKAAYPGHLEGVRRYVIDPPNRRDLQALTRALAAMNASLDCPPVDDGAERRAPSAAVRQRVR